MLSVQESEPKPSAYGSGLTKFKIQRKLRHDKNNTNSLKSWRFQQF